MESGGKDDLGDRLQWDAGAELFALLGKTKIHCVGTDMEVDITDPSALGGFADGKPIEWVVNCAAYTAVDQAVLDFAFEQLAYG